MSTKKPRNAFEKKLYSQLKRAKISFEYETEKIPYILARHYIPDFILQTRLGKIYIEAKGHLDREAKAKMVAVRKLHPELDIRIVFYSTNKKYFKWAEKAGFKYSVGVIPKEWLDGMP